LPEAARLVTGDDLAQAPGLPAAQLGRPMEWTWRWRIDDERRCGGLHNCAAAGQVGRVPRWPGRLL